MIFVYSVQVLHTDNMSNLKIVQCHEICHRASINLLYTSKCGSWVSLPKHSYRMHNSLLSYKDGWHVAKGSGGVTMFNLQ